jgi:flagellar motility protein MotE (MotC chaperone)
MKFCNECKLTPICAYSQHDYEIPDVFEIRCKFKENQQEQELPGQISVDDVIKDSHEVENVPFEETGNVAETDHDEVQETEENVQESEVKDIEEVVTEMMDDLDNESLQKYPAKKAAKPITPEKRAEVMKLYEKMKPDQIAKQLGIGKTSVYRIIKEELGMK